MSIAVGVSCADGAVVATDSQRTVFCHDGRIQRHLRDKIINTGRLVAAHRGPAPEKWGAWPTPRNSFSEASREIWEIVNRYDMIVAGERHNHHELVVAGGPMGQRVRLALFSSNERTRFAPPKGGVLIAGADEDYEPPNGEGWWPPRQPQTMNDCVVTALQLCTEIIRGNLARVFDRADIPSACWPVRMAVVTPRAVTTHLYHETHPECM